MGITLAGVARRAAVLTGVAILVAPMVLAAERAGAPARPEAPRPDGAQPDGARQPSRMKMLQPGQAAPDIELPRLVLEKDKDGNAVGKLSQERVKLSSFAGAKPVCLIFTSYT
jgi:hypothetical protein